MTKIKVGIVGAGQISYGHVTQINEHPGAEVVAVADPSEKRAKLLQEKFSLPQRYQDAKEMIADPEIDAVSIAVPNFLHAPVALDALKAGKHVLLDKPFALNYKEAQSVVAAAKKAKKVFTMGMNWRFNQHAQTIRALTDRKEFGEIYHAKATILRRCGIPKFGTWFCEKKKSGGGCMLDIGVHFLDLCLYAINNFKPVSVSGQTYTKFGNRKLGGGTWGMSDPGKHVFDVDDFASALIRFENGATVTLDVAWAMHQKEDTKMSVQLMGTQAGASMLPQAEIYRYGKKKGEYEVVEPQKVKPPYPGKTRFGNWIDAILKKDKLCCAPEEALAVQKILDGIYESSRTGKEVKL
jgi:predicted dehydrogenase